MRNRRTWHSYAAALAWLFVGVRHAAALPPGFEVTTFADGLDQPIAIEFAPDGRLFVAERHGAVRIIAGDTVGEALALVDVFTENENGLLGMALDPQFADNGWVYLYATVSDSEARILRFADPTSTVPDFDAAPGLPISGLEMHVVRDHLPTRGTFHSGGGLEFGPDGKLYFSIGDNLIAENGQDMNTLAGKVSRIERDGSAPDDNPFRTATGQPRSVFALGFRNPFRFCFAPDGRLFVLDVGSDGDGRREEVNRVRAGDNCGWPLVEGKQPAPADPAFTDPIFEYHDGGAAPVGAVVYSGAQFPEAYRGNLFFLEYVLNRLYRLQLDGDRVVQSEVFYEGDGGPVDLVQGPDGALYFTELESGRIRRLVYIEARVAGATTGGAATAGDALTTVDGAADGELAPFGVGWLCGAGAPWALGVLPILRPPRRTYPSRPRHCACGTAGGRRSCSTGLQPVCIWVRRYSRRTPALPMENCRPRQWPVEYPSPLAHQGRR